MNAKYPGLDTRFPSNPLIVRVPFFPIFSFNKETPFQNGKKGTTGAPKISMFFKSSATSLDISVKLHIIPSSTEPCTNFCREFTLNPAVLFYVVPGRAAKIPLKQLSLNLNPK